MMTSILLWLILLPARQAPDSRLQDARVPETTLSPAPVERDDLPWLARADAVDEEDDEEEFLGQGPAAHLPSARHEDDPHVAVRITIASPHLPIAWNRRRLPRSPPEG
jgi:hypothetical protein